VQGGVKTVFKLLDSECQITRLQGLKLLYNNIHSWLCRVEWRLCSSCWILSVRSLACRASSFLASSWPDPPTKESESLLSRSTYCVQAFQENIYLVLLFSLSVPRNFSPSLFIHFQHSIYICSFYLLSFHFHFLSFFSSRISFLLVRLITFFPSLPGFFPRHCFPASILTVSNFLL